MGLASLFLPEVPKCSSSGAFNDPRKSELIGHMLSTADDDEMASDSLRYAGKWHERIRA